MKRAALLLALVASSAAADPIQTAPLPFKLCDPSTRNCSALSLVGGSYVLKVDVVQTVGGGAGGTSSTYGAAFPATGTASGFSDGTNMQGARVFDLDTGAGTQYVAGFNFRLSANGGSVEGGTLANPLRTDPTGTTTQPVSGTVAATQSGTWTVQPGNTANTTAWKVDGSAVTQPVSSADFSASGTITAASSFAALSIGQVSSTAVAANSYVADTIKGAGMALVTITGTAGSCTYSFESTSDGTNWFGTAYGQPGSSATGTTTTTTTGVYRVNVGGASGVRVRAVLGCSGMNATVSINAGAGSTTVANTGEVIGVSVPDTVLVSGNGGTFPTILQDSTLTYAATVKAGSVSPVSTDTALVVAQRDAVKLAAQNESGGTRNIAVSTSGAVYVIPVAPPLNPFLARCNAIRLTRCQP